MRVPCSPSATGPVTASMPFVCSSAVCTAWTSPPGGTITSAGALAPAGKLSASRSWPSTDSTEVRYPSLVVRSVEKNASPAHMISSTTIELVMTRAGRVATRSPTRFQKPCVASERCSCLVRRTS